VRAGGNVEVSWPASATDDGYGLRATVTLSPPDWQPVGAPAVRSGDRDSVTLPATGSRFFQLVK
jgi:hypothetical protein